MKLNELLDILKTSAEQEMQVRLPDGSLVPAHFHLTEVGRVQKDFIDCGGTRRTTVCCSLQMWVATDYEHRLISAKLEKIIRLAEPLLQTTDLPVEVEYQADHFALYLLAGAEQTAAGLQLQLAHKQTACLAEDRCGISLPLVEMNDCSGPGCC